MRLLFVCMGNICRSPAAECVMRGVLERHGLCDRFECDSAGTIGYHKGSPPDARMRKAGEARGIRISGSARPVTLADLETFDLVLAMDRENRADLLRLACDADQRSKVRLMCDFLTRHDAQEVPDPYYGGAGGFERVLDLLEDACDGLMRHLTDR